MEEKKTECGRCGRELKTERSKKEGFGLVCKRKYEAEKAEAESKQSVTKGTSK